MSNNKQIYCLEFIGLWGSGKSLLIDNIYKNLINLNYKIVKFSDFYKYSKILRFLLTVKFITFNPIYFLKLIFLNFKFFLKLKPQNTLEYSIFKTLIKNQIIKNILLNKLNPDFLLWEGTFHLLPIFKKMNKIDVNDILNYSKSSMINENTCIVFLQIGINRCKKRIFKDNINKNKRFSSEEIIDINKNLYVMDKNQNILLNMIKNKIKNKIIIDTGKNKNFNIEKTKKFLLRLK